MPLIQHVMLNLVEGACATIQLNSSLMASAVVETEIPVQIFAEPPSLVGTYAIISNVQKSKCIQITFLYDEKTYYQEICKNNNNITVELESITKETKKTTVTIDNISKKSRSIVITMKRSRYGKNNNT